VFFVFDDNHGFLAGGFIDFLLHGDSLDDIVEFHLAGLFRKNGHVVRVPLDERFALLDLLAVRNRNDRTDNDVVNFQFAAILRQNRNGAVFVENDVVAVFEFDEAQFVVTDHAVLPGFDLRLFETGSGRSTNVESAHGKLRAGLADRLRGNDPASLAEFHQSACGQIAAIAVNANALLAFAGEHRTDFDSFHACGLNRLGPKFIDLLVGRSQKGLGAAGIIDVVARKPANETLAQLDDFVFAFIDPLHP